MKSVSRLVSWVMQRMPGFRWLVSRCLRPVYSVYDRFHPQAAVDCGPAFQESGPGLTTAELSRQLAPLFPNCSVAVNASADPGKPPDQEVFFQHQILNDDAVRQFRSEAGDLLDDPCDLFTLCDRLRTRQHHDVLVPAPNRIDPLQLLRLMQAGRGFTCKYFAALHGSLCATRGYTWRLLSLSRFGTEFDHAADEVYSPEHGKWIVFDPDFNIGYKRGGEYLSAWDLQKAWEAVKLDFGFDGRDLREFYRRLARQKERVAAVSGVELAVLGPAGEDFRRTNLFGSSSTGLDLEYFENVVYGARNDYFSGNYPAGHPRQSTCYMLRLPGRRRPPICPEAYPVDSPQDLYWPVGRSRLVPQRPRGRVLPCRLATWTPNFAYFEIRRDDGPSVRYAGSEYCWELHPGTNRLAVRSVNHAGLCGEPCAMEVTLTPVPAVTVTS